MKLNKIILIIILIIIITILLYMFVIKNKFEGSDGTDGKLDNYSVRIVSKYLKDINDYKNFEMVSKKFKDIPKSFYHNPIPLKSSKEEKIFDKVVTYYINKDDDISIIDKIINKPKIGRIVVYNHSYREVRQYKDKYPNNNKIIYKYVELTRNTNDFNSTEVVNLPEDINMLGDSCFKDCGDLSKITLPTSITSIGENCFANCYNLSEINIPTSITYISNYCFERCSNLSEITLPTSIEYIGDSCFDDCSSLSKITLPTSIISIGHYGFRYCISLSKIILPTSIEYIGDSCFEDCSNLLEINIPTSVKDIGDNCFKNCISLIKITVPEQFRSIFDDYLSKKNVEINII